MKNSTRQAVLSLLSAALFRKELSLPKNVDWEEVYDEAVAQSVVALAAPLVPENVSPRWKEAALQSRACYMRVVYEQKKLIELFKRESVPFVVLKGTAAAMYYPVPFDRAMGDVDLYTPGEHFEKGCALMAENGYFTERDFNERHTEYSKDGVLFELHKRFSACGAVEEYLLDGFGRREEKTVSSASFPVLPAMENGLVILDHVRHHLTETGLGLRQLCDWCMFAHRELTGEAWEKDFLPMAKAAGLDKLAAALTKICIKHLGLPRDAAACDIADDKTADMLLNKFFKDGNFGSKATRTPAHYVAINIKKKKLFPLLQEYGEKNWKAAREHPFLRRFAWLYQLAHYAVQATKAVSSGKNLKRDVFSARDKCDLLKRLGISDGE